MFSVTNTGMNFRPLWTANVCPINLGRMVDRRDQVLTTFFPPTFAISTTFLRRWPSTKGPFFSERAMSAYPRAGPLGRLLAANASPAPADDELRGSLIGPSGQALGLL